VKIYYTSKQKDLKISARSTKKLVEQLLRHLSCPCDEISIQFVTTKKICQLHEDFFNDPTTTDCITFPIDDPDHSGYKVLGEVFICPRTAIEYSSKKTKDPYKEATLYLVHGLLHLLGYDDIDPKARAQMRRKENVCMKFLKAHQLYLSA